MRRPFLWPAAGLAAGILVGKFVPAPGRVVFLSTLFLLPLIWFSRGRRAFLPLFLAAVSGIGILRIREALTLPAHHVSQFVQKNGWASLEGKVVSLPVVKEKGRRRVHSFVLSSENLVREGKFFETTGRVQVFLFNPGEMTPFGSRVRVRGQLLPPKAPENPGEFDYRRYLADQGIHAVLEGYGERSLRILSAPPRPLSPVVWIQKLRELSARHLDSLFEAPANQLLKALILGIRKDLSEEMRDDFIKTSTAHLVAVSGMNITLVAGSLFLIALAMGLPQKGAAAAGLVAATAYVFLSGAEIPVVRAGWMSGLFFTGLLLEREKDLLNSLFFAFFVILVFDPGALFQAGFQLSFLSVLSLLLLSSKGEERRGEWFQTVTVLIGTFPLCTVYFSVFSWTSVFANALAIPFFNLGVLAGLVALPLGKLPLAGPLLVKAASLALRAGVAWIHFWAEKPWGYVYLKPPSLGLIFFYYAALAFLLLVRRVPAPHFPAGRKIAFSIWLVVFACFFLPRKNSHFILTLLASGQSEIVDVAFPRGGHWLVNTGRERPSNQARWMTGPFLRRQGVNRLAGILLTDFSARHAGGLETLLRNFSVASVGYPRSSEIPKGLDRLFHSKRFKRIVQIPIGSEEKLELDDDAGFRVLGAGKDGLFLLVHYRGVRFLILPTWKTEAIRKAFPVLEGLSSVDVLVLPARGEPDPSDWEKILTLLLPEWVVIPHEKPSFEPVLDSLRREEIPYLSLATTGALRFEIGEGAFRVEPFLSPPSSR